MLTEEMAFLQGKSLFRHHLRTIFSKDKKAESNRLDVSIWGNHYILGQKEPY